MSLHSGWLPFALACLYLGSTAGQESAPPDSVRNGALLEALQRQDFELFPEEILEIDSARSDSLVAELKTLGIEGYEELADRRSRHFDFDFGLGTKLTQFNRVEGALPALAVELRPWGPRRMGLRGEGGYAFGSEEARFLTELEIPWIGPRQRSSLTIHHADRVRPFGSNRPYGNSLRALVAGADEQDYLRTRGGGAELRWRRGRARLRLGYEALRFDSIDVSSDFSFLREPGDANLAVDEGIGRSIVVGLGWGASALDRLRADVRHRLSGGALAGDFDYFRTDLSLEKRVFLRRFEVDAGLRSAWTGASTPLQERADVGGIEGVRGFPRRYHVGEGSLSARLEVLVPYDLLGRSHLPLVDRLRLQLIPFGDAARVFEGDSEEWISSVGLGLQRFLGAFGRASNLRLDLAVPLGADRPSDFHVSLRFAPGIL